MKAFPLILGVTLCVTGGNQREFTILRIVFFLLGAISLWYYDRTKDL